MKEKKELKEPKEEPPAPDPKRNRIDDKSLYPQERKKIYKLVDWMGKAGAKTSKLELQFYTEKARGVHAACDIKQGEAILFVPESRILTFKVASESSIGKQMLEKNILKTYGEKYFFCAFIL